MPSHPRRVLIQRNPQNDIGGVIQVIQVILVILWPYCILIAPLVRENSPLISFSDVAFGPKEFVLHYLILTLDFTIALEHL